MNTRMVRTLIIASTLIAGAARADRHDHDDEDDMPHDVPAALVPPAGEVVAFDGSAKGVQIYRCDAVGGVYAWTFVSPAATLKGEGRDFAIHYGGPTWQSISDGSSVVGKAIVKVPSPLSGAVPWLLLAAISHTGSGPFSHVTSIQRLETVGGAAPAAGCDLAHVGAQIGVRYTARYFFYKLASDKSHDED